MELLFDKMDTTVTPHMRGGEGEVLGKIFQDGDNRIMRLTLPPGASIGPHTHQENSEIIYVLSGSGKVEFDGKWEPLTPGVCHYCPQGHTHSPVNDGAEDLVFFAVIGEHGKKA